ncbi:MAG: NAD(P)/FAD-dependent oxidoreductase [Rhodomicrobium sp.]|nr:NAD(P)/FAD-dependent oxidoreductase [Rhodomicrobium sp.]
MLGLSLALRLQEAGFKVTVFEAAPELGGLASAWRVGDVTWDRHYHVTLLSDLNTRELLRTLGLEGDIHWGTTRAGCYANGRLYSVSTPMEFLRFPLLGPASKLRLAATIFHASRMKDWRALEKLTIEDWLRRWSGDRTYERFWRPLLISKLGAAHERTSAAFIWATIQRLFSARNNGLGDEKFGYVRGGYQRVLARFAEHLRARGVELVTGAPLRGVRGEGARLAVERDNGRFEVFDRAVVTTPPDITAALCPDLSADEARRLRAIEYLGVICASVLLSRPLGGFYVTNLLDGDLPFTGVIEMSALVSREELNNRCLAYLPRYYVRDDPFAAHDDETVRAEFLAGLTRMFPDLREDQILAFQISRAARVMPIPTIGYSSKVPPFSTSVPGLHIVNSSQIINGTLNVNETVGLAKEHSRRSRPNEAVVQSVARPRQSVELHARPRR